MPCQAASAGIFACAGAPPYSSRPVHPSGPRYWDCTSSLRCQASSSKDSCPSTFYVYTFFSDHVTAAPTYHKTAHTHAVPSLQDRRPREPPAMRRSLTPPTPLSPPRPSFVDYTFTASPRPLSANSLPTQSQESFPLTLPPPPRVVPRTPQPQLEVYIPPSLRRVRRDASSDVTTLRDDTTVVELDADGVVVDSEPNSPDKVGNETMLWPGR